MAVVLMIIVDMICRGPEMSYIGVSGLLPARSEASTESRSEMPFFQGFPGGRFCQAGEVAPPDSPTGGTFRVFGGSL
jgi:hypothetical protein